MSSNIHTNGHCLNASPPVNLPNYTACSTGTTTLNATGAMTYAWSPATNLTATTLTNTTMGTFSDCIWTLSDETVLNGCGSVSTVFSEAEFYDVTLQVASINGCFNTETYTDYIYVEDVIAAFTPSPSVISELSQEVNFLNNSVGAVAYIWNFGDNGATSLEEDPSHIYSEAQSNVEVELIAYSPLGCTDTARRILLVNEDPIFYVPNTFTPNGDEVNQYFQPVFTSGYDPNDFELLIFNRWVEIIWE